MKFLPSRRITASKQELDGKTVGFFLKIGEEIDKARLLART